MELSSILIGTGAGISYALMGFAKTQGEKFDTKRFIVTASLGAAVGLVAAIWQIDMEVAYAYAVSIGAVSMIENIYKAIARKVWPWAKKRL